MLIKFRKLSENQALVLRDDKPTSFVISKQGEGTPAYWVYYCIEQGNLVFLPFSYPDAETTKEGLQSLLTLAATHVTIPFDLSASLSSGNYRLRFLFYAQLDPPFSPSCFPTEALQYVECFGIQHQILQAYFDLVTLLKAVQWELFKEDDNKNAAISQSFRINKGQIPRNPEIDFLAARES